MRRIAVLLVAVLVAVLGLLEGAEAAKKKQSKPAAPPKPIYEAPMRVVIVRNSQPTCEPSCPQWIAAEGEITDATPALFRKVLKQMGKEKLPVIIRSPGGSINAALEIGKMLRQRKMTAAVGSTIFRGCSPADTTCKLPKQDKGIYTGMITEDYAFCNSACPMLLAGATTRYASYRTSIGLHEPKTTWLRTRTNYREYYRIVNGKKKVTSRKILSKKTYVDKTTYGLDNRLRKRLGDYYKSMGVDVAILEETVKAKFKDIYFLPDDKRASLKLRTTMEQAVFLGNPNLCGSGATSAVCVMDKARTPKASTLAQEKSSEQDPNSKPMTFRLVELVTKGCVSHCPKMIVAEGIITDQTPADFINFHSLNRATKTPLVLNSGGGNLAAAIQISNRLRMASVTTTVAAIKGKGNRISPNQIIIGNCKGACAVIFAGGTSRYLPPNQQIEFDHPYVLAGESKNDATLLKLTLKSFSIRTELMTDLYRLKKPNKLLIGTEAALKYNLANGRRSVSFVLESANEETNRPALGAKQLAKVPALTYQSDTALSDAVPIFVTSESPACKPDCPVVIYINGEITTITVQRLAEMMRRVNYLRPPVIFHSLGGEAAAAMELGKLLEKFSLPVAIAELTIRGCSVRTLCSIDLGGNKIYAGKVVSAGQCSGNCILAVAGGKSRMASSDAKVVGGYTIEGMNQVAHKSFREGLTAYFLAFGIDSEVSTKLSQLKAGDEIKDSEFRRKKVAFINYDVDPSSLLETINCLNAGHRTNCIRLP